ncbi:MAG: hypothetical protein P1V81_10400 [Planctomycetota bacterium]|nr:hypothetical protein [Planctomycetota bacterium]
MSDALLDLLRPELAPGEASHRRTVAAIQLARLLAGLGRGPCAAEVDLDLHQAGLDLDERLRAHALEVVEALFGACLPPEPGVPAPWPGRRSRGESAWRELLALEGRGSDLPLPSLPGPEESRTEVARRLLHGATCLGLSPGRAALWRAFLERAEGQLQGAEARFGKLAEDGTLDFETRATAIAGVLGACLERGAPAAARDHALAHLDLAAASLELRRPMTWALAAAGELELDAELAVPTAAALLPTVVAELGQRRPDLRELLTGGLAWDLAPKGGAMACEPRRRVGRRRAELGAAVVAAFRLAEGAAELAHFEAAPALDRPDGEHLDWVADRCVAPWDAAELEAEVLATGSASIVLPEAGTAQGRRLRRSCRSGACRGLALVPLGSPVRAWVRLEFEHELLPTKARLEAFAGALGRHLGIGPATKPTLAIDATPGAERIQGLLQPVLAGHARCRWWYLGQSDSPIACGGQAACEDHGLLRSVRADGLARVLESGGGSNGSRLDGDGSAALVLPVGPAWSPATSHLVIEGSGAPLGPRELERTAARLAKVTPELLLAAFGAWHRAKRGADVHLDPGRLDPWTTAEGLGTGEVLEHLLLAPSGLVVITGAVSTGRHLVADLALFLAVGPDLDPEPPCLHLRGVDAERLTAFLEDGGPRILEGIEELAQRPDLEALVLARAAGSQEQPLVLLGEGRLAGMALWPGLQRALAPKELHLAGLGERRREVPGILACLLRREARAVRALAPVLPDPAPVWRQDWDLSSLADLARLLVARAPGAEVAAPELEDLLAARLGSGYRRRSASKRPLLRTLWAALDSTRKQAGSYHRGRAASLLGWDPDTVTARIRDLGLADLG